MRTWPAVVALGWLGLGCREAVTPTGPGPRGPGFAPPSVTTFPGRDTTVDSIGLLSIQVVAHDVAQIDSVSLLISGAPIAFPADTTRDTVVNLLFAIPLATLHHRPFSYRVAAADVLGHDTLTDSVTVTLK